MGILIAFAVLIVLIIKKVPFTIAAVICAFLMAALSGLPAMETLTGAYMDSMTGFFKSYFLLYLTSSLFGAFMDASGAAAAIGEWLAEKIGTKHAVLCVSSASLLLVYGGVTAFVLVFTILPVANTLFRKADISEKLIPATICAGVFTSSNLMWGTPSLSNVIPASYLGTTLRAAPLLSTIISIFYFAVSVLFVTWLAKRYKAKGILNTADGDSQSTGPDSSRPPAYLAILPIITVLVLMNAVRLDIVLSLLAGTVLVVVLFYKRLKSKIAIMTDGTGHAVSAAVNTAAAVGLGGIAIMTPAFTALAEQIFRKFGTTYFSWSAIIGVISFFCGSAAGSLPVALGKYAETFLQAGLAPEALHKLASSIAICIAPMPWCGTIVTILAATKVSFKDGYPSMFVVDVVLGLATWLLCFALCGILY